MYPLEGYSGGSPMVWISGANLAGAKMRCVFGGASVDLAVAASSALVACEVPAVPGEVAKRGVAGGESKRVKVLVSADSSWTSGGGGDGAAHKADDGGHAAADASVASASGGGGGDAPLVFTRIRKAPDVHTISTRVVADAGGTSVLLSGTGLRGTACSCW